MTRARIAWSDTFVPSPITYWVHGDPPLLPLPVARAQGFARMIVPYRGHELVFSSPDELRHAIDVLGRRNLPRPSALARGRTPGFDHGRANSHWLSRFPAELRRYSVRAPLVAALEAALASWQ